MKTKLKILSLLLAALCLCTSLSACSNPEEPGIETENSGDEFKKESISLSYEGGKEPLLITFEIPENWNASSRDEYQVTFLDEEGRKTGYAEIEALLSPGETVYDIKNFNGYYSEEPIDISECITRGGRSFYLVRSAADEKDVQAFSYLFTEGGAAVKFCFFSSSNSLDQTELFKKILGSIEIAESENPALTWPESEYILDAEHFANRENDEYIDYLYYILSASNRPASTGVSYGDYKGFSSPAEFSSDVLMNMFFAAAEENLYESYASEDGSGVKIPVSDIYAVLDKYFEGYDLDIHDVSYNFTYSEGDEFITAPGFAAVCEPDLGHRIESVSDNGDGTVTVEIITDEVKDEGGMMVSTGNDRERRSFVIKPFEGGCRILSYKIEASATEPPYEGAPFLEDPPEPLLYYSLDKIEALEEAIFITDEEKLNSAAGSVTLTCPEAALDYLAGILLGNESPLQKSHKGKNFAYVLLYENEGDKIFDESTAIYDKFGGVYYDYTDKNTYSGEFALEHNNDCENIDSGGKTYYEIYLFHNLELCKGSGLTAEGLPTKYNIVRYSRSIYYAVYPDGKVKIFQKVTFVPGIGFTDNYTVPV